MVDQGLVPPKAANSVILITLIEGDSLLWSGMEVEELLFLGKDAEIEHEAGMLEDAIAPLFQPVKPGKYLLFGFTASYSKDYYGEADYALEGWREAMVEDEKQFHEPPPGALAPLADAIALAYATELNSWALAWLPVLRSATGLEQDVLAGEVAFTGREVVKALLSELPLPRGEAQEQVCRQLMGLLR